MPEYSCRVTLRTANWEVSFESVARIDFTWFGYCQNTSRTDNWEVSLENVARIDFTWFSYCQNTTMQKSLVTMMKQLNLHLRNVRQYVNVFSNAEGNEGDNMAMADDVLLSQGDPWMEFGDEEREKMLRAIAHAREVTNNELNHAYDKWEEFQDKKSVARETRVQNDKVYAEIQKAKEYENNDNDLNKW